MLSRVTTSLGEDTLVGYREGHMVLGRQLTAWECCCLPMFWVGLRWKRAGFSPSSRSHYLPTATCYTAVYYTIQYRGRDPVGQNWGWFAPVAWAGLGWASRLGWTRMDVHTLLAVAIYIEDAEKEER